MYISSKTLNAAFLEGVLGRFNGYIFFKKVYQIRCYDYI